MNKALRVSLGIPGATIAVALLAWSAPRLLPESTPVARGTADTFPGGCIECHGQSEGALSGDPALSCTGDGHKPTHPRYDGECRDFLAYFEAVRLKRSFAERAKSPHPNRLLQGERLARQYSCFQCHGELGQGGFPNAGALKGYVPGYFGDDFALLTREGNADSVRAWISQGIDPALLEHPIEGRIAGFFFERQAVDMPIYGTLSESEIEVLTDYVIALNRFGEMDAKTIRAYGRKTLQPPSGTMHSSAH